MECFWLSWVLVLWPIPGLRRFDRDASASWPSPTCRSRECWTSGQARRWPCGPETRRNAPGWTSRRSRRPLSEAGGSEDRKSVGTGKRVAVRVDHGGRRLITKQHNAHSVDNIISIILIII